MQISQLKQDSKGAMWISKLALCETTLKAIAEPLSLTLPFWPLIRTKSYVMAKKQ